MLNIHKHRESDLSSRKDSSLLEPGHPSEPDQADTYCTLAEEKEQNDGYTGSEPRSSVKTCHGPADVLPQPQHTEQTAA